MKVIWGYRNVLERGMSDFLIFGVQHTILSYLNSNE